MTSARALALTRREWPLAAVLGLAAFLRLFLLNYGEYQWDDDGIWSLAFNAVRQHVLPAKGINSTIGTGNGPFQVYLMMPFAALWHAPLAGMIGVALLNVAAVYFTYRLVREHFTRRAALIAAALFAVNSWAVVYSRHLAVQGMLIPFQVLFFWSAARWLARGRTADLVLAFLWLAIATQTYIDGLLHLGSMAVVLALGWRRLRLLPLLAGGAVWAAISARYLVEVIVGEWQFIQPSLNGPTIVDGASIWLALVQALHTGFATLAPQTQPALAPAGGVEWALGALEIGLYLAGIGWAVLHLTRLARAGKSADARVVGLLLAWLLFPIAIYIRHQDILSWRHLALTIPLPAIFTGLLLDRLWPRLGAPLLAALGVNSLGLAGVFFSTIPNCVSNNVYALPYRQTFDLAGSIEATARASGASRIYVYGQPSLGPVLGSILARDGLDAPWTNTADASSLAIPAPGSPPAVYVTLDDASNTAQTLRTAFAGQQRLEQAVPCEGMTVREYVLGADDLRPALGPLLPVSLDLHAPVGLTIERLNAGRRLTAGQPLDVAFEWSWTGGQRPAAPVTLFAHLVDGSGRQVAGDDRSLGKPSDWTAGQETVEWQRLTLPADLPPGAYSLQIGLYGDRNERLTLSDGSGKPIGANASWGPLVAPAPASQQPAGLTPVSVDFGGQIDLIGYQASSDGVTLAWRAVSPPESDYTVFVHVVDGSGTLVAQADSQPVDGSFPTGTWRPGESIVDRHKLSLPAGSYRLQVGLYDLATLQRLPGGPLDVPLNVP